MNRLFCCVAVLWGCAAATVAQAQSAEGQDGFSFYGQINRGVLSYDDGLARDGYAFVDNSKSVSRVGVTWDGALDGGWHVRGRGEVALRKRATENINQDDPFDRDYRFDRTEIRKVEVEFRHDQIGTFTVGQGAMAADGFTGFDFSLTTVVAGAPVQDAAGGMFLRRVDGTPSEMRINQAFRTMGSSRRLRLRYDSPALGGLRFAAAAGQEVLSYSNDQSYADMSLRYDGDHGDFRFRGGGAYRWIETDPDVFIASGSVLHRPSGLNFTLATGSNTAGRQYSYAKMGYIARWFDVGQTAISVDFYDGNDIDDMNGDSRSVGLAVVQKVKDPKIDFYALLRRYEYDTPSADYFSSIAFLAGARWQF